MLTIYENLEGFQKFTSHCFNFFCVLFTYLAVQACFSYFVLD